MFQRYIQLIMVIVVTLVWYVFPVIATDYASTTFIIRDPAIGEGGVHHATSTNFQLRSTVGGVEAIGESSSTNFIVKSGFQYYDDTGPDVSGAVVNDGLGADIDEQSSLNTIQANWSGFSDPESGLRDTDTYNFAIRRLIDGYYWNSGTTSWQSGESWTATTTTSININPLYLRTSYTYYVSVKAYNNLDIASDAVDSDGVQVIETLSFSLSSFSVQFNNLNPANSYTDTAYTTTTVTTNAYNGYIITAWETAPMTHQGNSFFIIADWTGTNAAPSTWIGNCTSNSECGFGYTTNDNTLSGGTADRFTNGGPNYAGFTQTGEGDPVADHTDKIDGSTGELSSDEVVISYKISTNATQAAGTYSTTIIYIATAEY